MSSSPPDIRDGNGFLYVAGQLLVNVNDIPLVANALGQVGAVRQNVNAPLDRYVALYQVPDQVNLINLVQQLRSLPGEPRVGPNHAFFGSAVHPAMTLVGQPKYHGGPGDDPQPAPDLGPVASSGGAPVSVAVIDTGIDLAASSRPLLRDNLDPSLQDRDAVYVAGTPPQIAPMGGHGTMVAGIIARNCPQARILSARALTPDGTGTEDAVSDAMVRALDAGAQVLNLSLGGTVMPGMPPVGIDAVLTAHEGRAAFVAAAGNTPTPTPDFYPAYDSRVVAVAALDTTVTPADPVPAPFSNCGPWVDACAPGVSVHSAYVTGDWDYGGYPVRHFTGYASWSGTSFATPHVAAVVADRISSGVSLSGLDVTKLAAMLGSRTIPDYGVVVVPPNAAVYVPTP